MCSFTFTNQVYPAMIHKGVFTKGTENSKNYDASLEDFEVSKIIHDEMKKPYKG